MRELDSSSPVSPERWEGGRPQRARHMSAMESGTEMSPCPRGYRRPARDALDAVMMLSSRPGMEVRRVWEVWVVCCTADAAKGASARRGKARARVGKEQPHCCTSPGAQSQQSPCAAIAHDPLLILPNRSCAVSPPIANRGKGAATAGPAPPHAPIISRFSLSPFITVPLASLCPSQPRLVMPPALPRSSAPMLVGHVARRASCLFRRSLTGAAE
jgi:hypothetical protein